MERIVQIAPANGNVQGGKIGVGGDTLWILPEVMRVNISQRFLNKTQEADVDGPLVFAATREFYGTLQIGGKYQTEDGHIKNALGMMSATSPTFVQVVLDTGHYYQGYVYLEKDGCDWKTDTNAVLVNVLLRFSGWIVGDGGDSSGGFGTSTSGGDDFDTLIKDGALRHVNYQDTREDTAYRPFLVGGVEEGGVSPLDAVKAAVVSLTGGATQTWRGDSTLKLRSVDVEWAGYKMVRGRLVYGRGPADCHSRTVKWDIGYDTDGTQGVIASGDSGGSDDVCASQVGIEYRHRIYRTTPLRVAYVPCVWSSTNPASSVDSMVGKINANSFVVDGVTMPAYEARFDGLKDVEKFRKTNGDYYYAGYLKIVQKIGGWKKGTLTCIRWFYLPLEGDQAVASAGTESSVRQLYAYASATFSSIASLCPICYG